MGRFKCKILKCECEHSWQDKEYGPKKRVHNPMQREGTLIGYRCTVCRDEKTDRKYLR